ncbi:FAD-dependent oxidoreductase [Hyalangium versicolor]|uniref:FAD-dependent oxidoreductase n=1 Tax=Hyalangium versicolor TaxID=2861190 RepID=UPI001CCB9C37|nr:FAD-dependent oxidoreductase [Hyalangium versicolor]
MNTPGRRFGRAVVIGGSMAGLLSARVLADHFEKVVLLERDPRPEGPVPRKGVPQGSHIHVLLDSGRRVLDRFFPDLFQHLQEQGAQLIDSSGDVAWHHFDVWKPRYTSGIPLLLCTRTLLEWNVLRRVVALPNVELRDGYSVEGLLTDTARQRVTGVQLKSPGGEEPLEAELVVDASGRGSRAPQWLEALGYGRPEEEQVGVDLAYTSGLYEPPANFGGEWSALMQYPAPPSTWRSGFIGSVEGGRWLVTLNGYFGEHAPTEHEGFLDFARALPRPDFHAYLRDAKPLGPLTTHKVKHNRWRHYERMARFPEGLALLGDAVCAFNPVFGQGMSVAGLGAELLHECLCEHAQRSPGELEGMAERFRKRLPGILRLPWFVSTSLDLQYPQATGQRMPGLGLLHWYIRRLLERTSRDTAVHAQFNRMLHLQAGLGAVLQPSVSLPVLAHGVRTLFVPLRDLANTDTLPLHSRSEPG